jgi:hypothetical protein
VSAAGGPARAYSSTVVAPGQVIAGLAAGAAAIAWLLLTLPVRSPVIPLLAGALIAVSGVYLGTVRLAVGRGYLVLGRGPFGSRGRRIPLALVTDARAESLSAAQVYGLGMPWHWRTTRMTIRRGPALALTLASGEHITISTADPRAAVAIIRDADQRPPGQEARPGGPARPADEGKGDRHDQ